MFCNNCGKEIDEDCIFCPSCGISTANSDLEKIKLNETAIKQKHIFKDIITTILFVTIISFILVFAIGIIPNWIDASKESHKATKDDISIQENFDFSLNISCTITPKTDIKSLILEFEFYDRNHKVLTRKEKNLGNVSKGIDYKISFPLSEFSSDLILNMSYYFLSITQGQK